MIDYDLFTTNEDLKAFLKKNKVKVLSIYSTPVGLYLWYEVKK